MASVAAHLAALGRWRRIVWALLLLGCGADAATAPVPAPSELTADAVGGKAVRITWKPSDSDDIAGYELLRRTNLQGDFITIKENIPSLGDSRVTFFDTDVQPDTYYGYSVRAISRFGARSAATNVAGTKTAPPPALLIRTATTSATAEAVDPDGYSIVIRGPRDTTTLVVGVSGERRVPAVSGSYSIVLRGLANNCTLNAAGDTLKSADVTDEGMETVTTVSFTVGCRDPHKATIVVLHSTTGDTLDADGLQLSASAVLHQTGKPDSAFFESRMLSGATGITRFDNLIPADYELSIGDVDPPCALTDNVKRVASRALAIDTVRFALSCRKPPAPVDTAGRVLVVRNTWSSATAKAGDRVSLTTELDLTGDAAVKVSELNATIGVDPAVVRFDSVKSLGAFDIAQVIGSAQSGVLSIAASTSAGTEVGGKAELARWWFTVVGNVTSAASTRTATTIATIRGADGSSLDKRTRAEDATFTVGTASANQPPTAAIAGPATGVAGTAVTFSAADSRDADGTIASYAWNFGDGATGTGVSASHAYAASGDFTVVLTVTDNAGATASKTATITIAPAGTQAGTVTGTITKSTGGGAGGVHVVLTPLSTSTPRPEVAADGSGTFTVTNVPLGAGTITLSALPGGCAAPAALTYDPVTAGGTVTKDITLTCTPTEVSYPLTSSWGPITTGGPTGRQVTLTLEIDMGTAPGRPDINGANADSLSSISFSVAYDGTALDYVSRSILSPELDLVAAFEERPGTATAQTNVAVSSASGTTKGGRVPLVRLTFNIAAGFTGSITPTITLGEVLATVNLVKVNTTTVVVPPVALVVP